MKILYTLIFSLIVLTSCYKDEVDETVQEFPSYPETIIESTDVKTIVWNEDGTLVSDYAFTFSNETYSNTAVSHFSPSNIKAVGEIFTIHHQLGFDLNYPLLNLPNEVNIHQITLPNIQENISVEIEEEYLIPFLSDGSLQVFANGIVNSITLQPESTTVWYKSFSEKDFFQVPLGITDNENLQRAILTFNQVSFIAFGKSSEELVLKDYELELENGNILYYFDSSKSRWLVQNLKEPMSTGFYALGEVLPAAITEIAFDGVESLSQFEFQSFFQDIGLHKQIITPTSRTLAYLPADLSLSYKISSLNEEFFTGAFSASQNALFKELTIPIETEYLRTINYELLDCTYNSIDNAYLILTKDNRNYLFAETEGNAIRFYQSGSEDISFQFSSIDENIRSTKITLKSVDNYKLNKQFLCSNIGSDFIVIDVNQTMYIFEDISCTSGLNEKTITGNNGIDEIALRIKSLTSGMISDEDLNMYLNAPNIATGYTLNCLDSELGCGFTNFEMSSYEEESGYSIKGYFEGTFWIESINENNVGYRSLSGEFQLEAK